MKIFRLIWLVLLAPFLLPFIAHAQTELVYCNWCTTQTSYQRIVEASANVNTTEIYVLNASQNQLQRFDVYYIPAEQGVPAHVVANQVPLTNSVSNASTEVFNALDDFKNLFFLHRDIPESVISSPYQLVNSSFRQQQVVSYYKNQGPAVFDRLANSIGFLASILGKVINVKFTVNLNSADGGYVVLQLTGISSDGFSFQVVDASDGDGNKVAFNKESYLSGEYKFEDTGRDGLEEFLKAAHRSGATSLKINDSRYSNYDWVPGKVTVLDCVGEAGNSCIIPEEDPEEDEE